MPRHEGFVATLKKDGKAEVVIQPVHPGVPGASSYVNRHVCHCASGGSTVTIEALNGANAEVGDYVSVLRDTSGLLKNAVALLGVPVLGLIAGVIFAAVLTDGFSSHMATGMIAIAACLIVGITIGVLIFRRISVNSDPIIENIIQKRRQGDPLFTADQLCSAEPNRDCRSCVQ
ncbi:MAG: SoxR reducing system RseC family protein [Deltaproteobacteria bacterium]|nr:SoxR reducing system RseC family protein [Deltaproteobacteria bacterium]